MLLVIDWRGRFLHDAASVFFAAAIFIYSRITSGFVSILLHLILSLVVSCNLQLHLGILGRVFVLRGGSSRGTGTSNRRGDGAGGFLPEGDGDEGHDNRPVHGAIEAKFSSLGGLAEG